MGIRTFMAMGMNLLLKSPSRGAFKYSLGLYGNPQVLYTSQTEDDFVDTFKKYVVESKGRIREGTNIAEGNVPE